MRSLSVMRDTGYPVLLDANPALKLRAAGGYSGGQRKFIGARGEAGGWAVWPVKGTHPRLRSLATGRMLPLPKCAALETCRRWISY